MLAGSPAIGAPVHLASNTTFSAAASTTLTMTGPIDGSGGLTMTGGGKLLFNAANTFAGGLVVQSGEVVVTAASGLLDGSNVIVGSASAFGSVVASAAAPVAGRSEDSGSTTSASNGLSPRAVAAVMAGPPMPPVRTAPVFPRASLPNLPQSVKDFWWRL